MTDRAEIRRIEELSLNAWPALRQMSLDGWLLRFADGCTRRCNSVQPLYPGTMDIRRKIQACADHYARQNLPLIFKMTDAVEPADLNAILERAGFASTARTSVQVCGLDGLPSGDPRAITCHDHPTSQWIDFTRFDYADPPIPVESQKRVLKAIVSSIVPAANFGAVIEDDEIRAAGLAICEGSWVGLFDIATAPEHRRRGYARRLVNGVLDWGRVHGATNAYLQVILDNAPALRMYESLGFREQYQYWYRQRAC